MGQSPIVPQSWLVPGTAPGPHSLAVSVTAPSQSYTHPRLEAQTALHPHPVPLLCAHSFQVSGWPEVASGWSAPEQGQGTLRMEPGQEAACRNSSPGYQKQVAAKRIPQASHTCARARTYVHARTHAHAHETPPPTPHSAHLLPIQICRVVDTPHEKRLEAKSWAGEYESSPWGRLWSRSKWEAQSREASTKICCRRRQGKESLQKQVEMPIS